MEEQFKRNIAYKLRIEKILAGIPIIENERFSFLNLENQKIIRINVIGSIVDKYVSDGEKKFLFLTLDDGSGQIKIKSFGDDAEKFSWISQGQIVIVIGTLRFFNNEVYISPETVREQNPKYLIVRKLETEKQNQNYQTQHSKPIQQKSLRESIIDLIKNSESNGGISMEILNSSTGMSSETVSNEIGRLLEEGTIFEPRPGIVRWLG
ncbi:MAG TPA: OB-fold nucleic acid binding domain-containing protein [Candidatus Nanoarchaeia archaeon]|nr:OB-fold nucleic acid binding domain-containing protein [Candidatus Nanoarchaeia archaeon]